MFTADANVIAELQKSAEDVSLWVEANDYRAYDPGDGDFSFLRYLTLNTHFMRRLLTGAVLRAPFHVRPWIGIKPHSSTKGMGYMAWGYLKMYALTGEDRFRRRAEQCFDWLIEHRCRHYDQYCWGNHFSFSTRSGTIPRHTPTIVWSGLIALAFLEGYEIIGARKYLYVASSTAKWVKSLPKELTDRGACLSYVPVVQSSIHNSNMLGAALLARIAAYTNDLEALRLSESAMAYSCARQNADGGWFYGEAPMYHWIDSFHTGYNLDSLKRYADATKNPAFDANLQLGFQYFRTHFFERDGRPKYYHDRTYPTDIQCAAQAIDTLTFFSDADPAFLELATKVACWTIRNMQAEDGHFYYRDLGWTKVKTPMLHWGQGTMFKALAHLLTKLRKEVKTVVPDLSREILSNAGPVGNRTPLDSREDGAYGRVANGMRI